MRLVLCVPRLRGASGVSNDPGSFQSPGRSHAPLARRRPGFLQQLLPAGETGVDLVPVPYLGLALPPAQTHLAALHPAREVDQAHEEVLQLDAELTQLLNIAGHPLAAALEFLLGLMQLFAVNVVEISRRARDEAG